MHHKLAGACGSISLLMTDSTVLEFVTLLLYLIHLYVCTSFIKLLVLLYVDMENTSKLLYVGTILITG
jgi:hypothetical protein